MVKSILLQYYISYLSLIIWFSEIEKFCYGEVPVFSLTAFHFSSGEEPLDFYHLGSLNASKVMLKTLQARLQQCLNRELPDVQAGFRKGRGTRDQIANICWIIEKAREFQKNIYFCFIDYAKAFVWITINCGKFWKRWDYQTTWPASWETYIQVRKQQLELDMEQQTGSK